MKREALKNDVRTKKMNSLQHSLQAAKTLEEKYKKYRQTVALENLKEIQKQHVNLKLVCILNEVKLQCHEVDGYMSKEMIQKIDSIIATL